MENENEVLIPEVIQQPQRTQVVVEIASVNKMQQIARKVLKENEVRKEEEKQKLIEEGNMNELDLKTLLSREDYNFYYEKKLMYLNEYPELTDPFDQDDLHHMIMEQIFQRNMLKKKKKVPSANIMKEYQESVKRENDFKKSLSMRRTDRVKGKDVKQVVNIAELSVRFEDKGELAAMQQRVMQARQEEAILRQNEKAMD
jgi:hypothetical protein